MTETELTGEGQNKMDVEKVKVGIIGAGMISGTYLDNLCRRFEITEVVGIRESCSDRKSQFRDRARDLAFELHLRCVDFLRLLQVLCIKTGSHGVFLKFRIA